MSSLSIRLNGHSCVIKDCFHIIMLHKPDILYIDINCIKGHGSELELLKQLCTIIILSDLIEDAFQAFEYHAFDYLLKPVTYSRFVKGVEKYYGIKMRSSMKIMNKYELADDYFFVKVDLKGFKEIKINYVDLIYVEAMQNYVILHIEGEKTYLSYNSLKKMEEFLPQGIFSRIHKSFIINDSKIVSIEGNLVALNNDSQRILIGNTYRRAFFEKKNRKMFGCVSI